MKEKSKIEFVSILQDEEFICLVKKALVSDSEMVKLFNTYSDQGESLRYAVEFIKRSQIDRKQIDQIGYDHILKCIKDYSISQKKISVKRRLLNYTKIWRAAAIFIVFISTTLGIYHYYKFDPLAKFAQKEMSKTEHALIILSDGSSHQLGENDTLIEYSNNGGEVIVKSSKLSEEKLNNIVKSNKTEMNEIVVPFGHRHIVKLCDGTQVHLNAGSKLVFPAEFIGKTREVYLKGEGYFEVKKNPSKPFIVKTDFINVKVLGTVFSVSAYGDEQTVSTVLVEGSVNVSQKNKIFNNTEYTLQPGQGYFYSVTSSNAVVKKVDIDDYILWKDGLYQFHNQPFMEIARRVEKYYNISILIGNNQINNTIVSGKLVLTDESENVINYLAKTLEVKYERKDGSTFLLK